MYVMTWENGRPKRALPVDWTPIRDAHAECKRLASSGAIPTRLTEACVNMSSKDMMSRTNCLAVLDSLDWMESVYLDENNHSTTKGGCMRSWASG